MTSETIPPPTITFETDPRIVAMNERNRLAAKQSQELALVRFADLSLSTAVLSRLAKTTFAEFQRFSLDEEFAAAEILRDSVISNLGRKGAAARQPNPFQDLCRGIVRCRPAISLSDFVAAVEGHKGLGVIVDVDEEGIHYQVGKNQPLKTAHRRAMKDVLSRIKKTLPSR